MEYERAHVGRQDLGSIGTELALALVERAQALPFGAVVAGNVVE